MTDEPYRWLEAVANRREYIRDQLKGATPVFAFSRPEGVLLFGVGTGLSKVFEIYDRQAFAALGHPVDIEKVRQTTIEAAHLEGFTRAAEDVTVRRLLNFSLSPALKAGFEQIFAAPLIVESILAEVGVRAADDVIARVGYDGTFRFETGGVAVAHSHAADEAAAGAWLRQQLQPEMSLSQVVRLALATWKQLTASAPFVAPTGSMDAPLVLEGKTLEIALLHRSLASRARYRILDSATLL